MSANWNGNDDAGGAGGPTRSSRVAATEEGLWIRNAGGGGPGPSPGPSLQTLPDEAILESILSFSLPREECQAWEWIGVLGRTCRQFRSAALSLAPPRLKLADFNQYRCVGRRAGEVVDARVGILRSLISRDWMRRHLKEFHVNWDSVAPFGWDASDPDARHNFNYEIRDDEDIRALLHELVNAPPNFPKLEWLDIGLLPNNFGGWDCQGDIVNSESLRRMPSAFPSLKKLSLHNCFREGPWEVSPEGLAQFFKDLHLPLEWLSFGMVNWITDAHVKAFLAVVGRSLTRLEIIDSRLYCGTETESLDVYLTDGCALSIAKYCSNLQSFAITDTNITSAGLEQVVRANPNIDTLHLYGNSLDASTVHSISSYVPRLRVLRGRGGWLDDDSLIALVDAQKSGRSSIALERIMGELKRPTPPGGQVPRSELFTMRGLTHAITNGLEEIEIEEGSELHRSIRALGPGVVKTFQAKLYNSDVSL